MAEKKTEAKPKAAPKPKAVPKPKAPPKPKDPVVVSIKASQLTDRELRFLKKAVLQFHGKYGIEDLDDVALLCLKQYISNQRAGGVKWAVPQLKLLARKL
tara:strand:- start:964 stop:1263 length:300 start_codon:yes stop_codon:yes gene_type:complete